MSNRVFGSSYSPRIGKTGGLKIGQNNFETNNLNIGEEDSPNTEEGKTLEAKEDLLEPGIGTKGGGQALDRARHLENGPVSDESNEVAGDDARVSRLFYLQLYSSVLKAEKKNAALGGGEAGELEEVAEADDTRDADTLKSHRKKTLSEHLSHSSKKLVSKSLSWMDVTNLLSRQSSSGKPTDQNMGDSYIRPNLPL